MLVIIILSVIKCNLVYLITMDIKKCLLTLLNTQLMQVLAQQSHKIIKKKIS